MPMRVHSLEDVIRVRDHSKQCPWLCIVLHHVLVRRELALATPTRDRRVFGGWNRESGHRAIVVPTSRHQGFHGIRTLEIHKVTHTTKPSRFCRRHTTTSEVMELEGKPLHGLIIGRSTEGVLQYLLDSIRNRG